MRNHYKTNNKNTTPDRKHFNDNGQKNPYYYLLLALETNFIILGETMGVKR